MLPLKSVRLPLMGEGEPRSLTLNSVHRNVVRMEMMKPSSMLSALTVVGAVLCASAVAQARYCIGGDLEHLSKAQKDACNAKMQTVRNVAGTLHAPANWHFVVVCGEEGWKQYAAYAMHAEGDLLNAMADTNYEQHETFFRERGLDEGALSTLQSSVAREVAGILSHHTQEAGVDTDAARLAGSHRLPSGL